MHRVALVLACLACAGQAIDAGKEAEPLKALAALLHANGAAAFKPSSLGAGLPSSAARRARHAAPQAAITDFLSGSFLNLYGDIDRQDVDDMMAYRAEKKRAEAAGETFVDPAVIRAQKKAEVEFVKKAVPTAIGGLVVAAIASIFLFQDPDLIADISDNVADLLDNVR
mmetsp:Transcript_154187/g.273499  ORF Transcript_154187/g.273499 Transcript_154187/m.273499 type:complete len:169 (-) Transcript_154187:99-605(-)